ncbi:hypothetical protein V8F33_005847 [Rhypophila sp. PSN 637]
MSQPEQTSMLADEVSGPVATAALGAHSASPLLDPPAAAPTARHEDRAKIHRLLRARRVVARRHRDEIAQLRGECDWLVSLAGQAADAKLQAQVEKAEHEAAVWRRKFEERVLTEVRGASGASLALQQANQRLGEQDAVIEKLREELVLARMGDTCLVTGSGEATATSTVPAVTAPGAAPVAAVGSSSRQGMASASDLEVFPAAGPSSQATSSGPSAVPASADNTSNLATISRRLVDKEIELTRAAHQLAQQTELASSEHAKIIDLADQLSSAHTETEELRGKTKDLTAELASTRDKLADAEKRVFEERTSRQPDLHLHIGQTNDRFDAFIRRATEIFREVWENVGTKLVFACGIESRQVNNGLRAFHPEAGDISITDGFEHFQDICRDCERELRERKENFDQVVEAAKEQLQRTKRDALTREEKEITDELETVLDDRGAGDITEEDLFNWEERLDELFDRDASASRRIELLDLLGDNEVRQGGANA